MNSQTMYCYIFLRVCRSKNRFQNKWKSLALPTKLPPDTWYYMFIETAHCLICHMFSKGDSMSYILFVLPVITSHPTLSASHATNNIRQHQVSLHLRHQIQSMLPLAPRSTCTDAGAPGDEICLQHLLGLGPVCPVRYTVTSSMSDMNTPNYQRAYIYYLFNTLICDRISTS